MSAEHESRGVKHDASSVWLEDITKNSFKICVRELQNFDGVHESIHVVCDLVLTLFVISLSSKIAPNLSRSAVCKKPHPIYNYIYQFAG